MLLPRFIQVIATKIFIMAPNLPPRSSKEGLQRTKSDIISCELLLNNNKEGASSKGLPTLSEVEMAKCECCGMSEECTAEYIDCLRERFAGKVICGLCSEAVKEEMGKNRGRQEEALEAHMSACVRFNRIGRAYPVLYQADNVKKILKKSCTTGGSGGGRVRMSSKGGGIARSSSCIPAITEEMRDKLRF